MSGWIKIHRSLLEWEWYDDNNVKVLFLHLLLKANHKDKNYRGTLIPRGSLLTGRDVLSAETGLSVQQIRNSLNKLKSTSEITIKSTNKGSLVTLVKYSDYQTIELATTSNITSKPTNDQPATNQQPTTNKNVRSKEDNNNSNDKPQKSAVPYDAIIDLYHEKLPDLPSIQVKTTKRKNIIKKFWNYSPKHQDLDFLSRYFDYIKESDFLMGLAKPMQGSNKPFQANLEWILNIDNFANIIERKYHEA